MEKWGSKELPIKQILSRRVLFLPRNVLRERERILTLIMQEGRVDRSTGQKKKCDEEKEKRKQGCKEVNGTV